MKRKLLLTSLLITSLFSSNYEVFPLVGLDTKDEKSIFAIEIEKDNNTTFNPEFSILYKNDSFKNYRFALNNIYYFKESKKFLPFAKFGAGFSSYDGNIFFNTSAGLKYLVKNNLSLKVEANYFLDYHGQNQDKYNFQTALLFGLSFKFGYTKQKTIVKESKEIKKEKKVTILDDDNDGVANEIDLCFKTRPNVEVDMHGCEIDGDDDNDGIKNSIDKCTRTPQDAQVYSNGCMIDNDSDGDGIKDSIDKCLLTPIGIDVDINGCEIEYDSDNDGIKDSLDACDDTPIGAIVDANGCQKEPEIKELSEDKIKEFKHLAIKFRYKSFKITADTIGVVLRLANLLNEYENYKIKILGYTDNVGSARYNKKLSKKRAEAVKDVLLQEGIEESRIEAVGMGKDNPIASNKTSEGRAQNRRIEVEFIKD